jgi:hypothetical protein
MKMSVTEDNKLMFGALPTCLSARNEVKVEALHRGGLALRGARATGLSAASPANAHNPRASGFPLLSLAEALRISFHGFTQSTTRTYHFRIKHITEFLA